MTNRTITNRTMTNRTTTNNRGKLQVLAYLRACLLGMSLLFPHFSIAQEDPLQLSIDAASNALQELDDKAAACLPGSTRSTSSDEAKQSCDDFLSAIDGELMASYLDHCATLKSWRDNFVSQVANSTTEIENSEEMLRRLIGVEFTCGQNALPLRTRYVVTAFSQLQAGKNMQVDAKLSRRLAELNFATMEERARVLLQQSVGQQQSRSQLETERQSNSLEIELIRQQIRNSPPPN